MSLKPKILAAPSIILGVETANPPHSMTQAQVLSVLNAHLKLSGRAMDLYRKFLRDEAITRRYFAWEDPKVLLSETLDDKMKRFERWAVDLSVQAATRLLQKQQCGIKNIDAVFAATCTGYLCPGLSTYISQHLGLGEHVHAVDLVGLGCAGAMPALRSADDYLSHHPEATVLVIATEICSAATHWAEKPDLILSNAIFSDGSAAVLLSNRAGSKGLKINRIKSLLWPQFRDELRFKYMDARLCNVISPRVPGIAARAMAALYQPQESIPMRFAFHAGGRKVLEAIQPALKLNEKDMRPSRKILKDYGNMSSPSVLFVLKDIWDSGLQPQEQVACFSFGAGFMAAMLQAGPYQG